MISRYRGCRALNSCLQGYIVQENRMLPLCRGSKAKPQICFLFKVSLSQPSHYRSLIFFLDDTTAVHWFSFVVVQLLTNMARQPDYVVHRQHFITNQIVVMQRNISFVLCNSLSDVKPKASCGILGKQATWRGNRLQRNTQCARVVG